MGSVQIWPTMSWAPNHMVLSLQVRSHCGFMWVRRYAGTCTHGFRADLADDEDLTRTSSLAAPTNIKVMFA